MNEIMRSMVLETAKYEQRERILRAEHFRLLAEAPQKQGANVAGLIREPVGRAIVAVGRWIQGGSSAPHDNEFDAGSALKPAQ